MPRRSILSATERESLLALPDAKDELIRHYTFNETDLSVIRQRRGAANRLGFAVQLCYLRFPGIFLGIDEPPFPPLLRMVAAQLKVPVESWNDYGQREQTRREHLVELQTVFGFKPFTMSHYRQAVHTLTELALQTDKGIVLASTLVENLRRQSIILPAMNAIERASAEAITRANRRIYAALTDSLLSLHRQRLDELLKRKDGSKLTWLAWLRQSPVKPNFTHLKTGDTAKDKTLLLTTILADGINLGLTKMAESCPGTTYAKLSWLQAWHIRDETYSTALAELVNAQFRQSFAGNWGDGTTSSSDGQNFRTGSKAESTGHINPKYGSSPGRTFYTHISDQYAPFSTKVVNVGVRDSTYVLDGLLYHESDLRIEEHYTDTAGFTDHVFGLMHLLGFRFAPRIRDLGDTKLFIPKGDAAYDALKPMISSDRLNIKQIRAHWDEILRFATSIKQGTVTASLMLRKLGSYPRQNGLAVALRELGRIERTLFILDWLQSVELRRRVQAGLNKGEARNALARAVFFNRLGEIRDRSFEQQRYRASGLNLVTAAIVLWNTAYLERATNALNGHGKPVDETLFQYLSPLGWEHINLTGDYLWRSSTKVGAGKFRPLRPLPPA